MRGSEQLNKPIYGSGKLRQVRFKNNSVPLGDFCEIEIYKKKVGSPRISKKEYATFICPGALSRMRFPFRFRRSARRNCAISPSRSRLLHSSKTLDKEVFLQGARRVRFKVLSQIVGEHLEPTSSKLAIADSSHGVADAHQRGIRIGRVFQQPSAVQRTGGIRPL